MNLSDLYPVSYTQSRERFRQALESILHRWPGSALEQYCVDSREDLTIDWISAPARGENKNLLILTTGEHGIEGYVGSAVLQQFFREFMPRLDPQYTGLLLVHAINPWGMAHWRRVNVNNVDLNRSFLWPESPDSGLVGQPDKFANPSYKNYLDLLLPAGPAGSLVSATLLLLLAFARQSLNGGLAAQRNIILNGQYHTPDGLYYGGDQPQAETVQLAQLYREYFAAYHQIVHIDVHTGYGPRMQMTLVNSAYDPGASQDFAKRFNYPLVVKTGADEFYPIQGDMVDYVSQLARHEFPSKALYTTAFEFGTFGDSMLAMLRSFRAMVLENQLFWHGAKSERSRRAVQTEFREMFFPGACDWRVKALADSRQALAEILKAYEYLA